MKRSSRGAPVRDKGGRSAQSKQEEAEIWMTKFNEEFGGRGIMSPKPPAGKVLFKELEGDQEEEQRPAAEEAAEEAARAAGRSSKVTVVDLTEESSQATVVDLTAESSQLSAASGGGGPEATGHQGAGQIMAAMRSPRPRIWERVGSVSQQ